MTKVAKCGIINTTKKNKTKKEREIMENYEFTIQFIEDCDNANIKVNDKNTIVSQLTLTERTFKCSAPCYEVARLRALDFAQYCVREFYAPLGVWVAFRLCH